MRFIQVDKNLMAPNLISKKFENSNQKELKRLDKLKKKLMNIRIL